MQFVMHNYEITTIVYRDMSMDLGYIYIIFIYIYYIYNIYVYIHILYIIYIYI